MATPTADSYSVASGLTLYGGIAGLWAGDVVLAGDSLTSLAYQSGGYRFGLPLTMHPPRTIYNAGIPNNTTTDLLNRFDTDVIAKGAAIALVRIGTNGGNVPGDYTSMFTKLKTAGMKGVFFAIPPVGLGTAGVMSPINATNVWLKAQCEADPNWLQFVDDSRDLGDAYYNCIPSFYIDNIHMNGKGVVAQGRAMSPRLKQILAQVDPRIVSASDIYPANSASNQWSQNPFNTGTSGTFYYATGVAPTGASVSCSGVTSSGAISSIVAADAGDGNQTPWHRVRLTQGVGNGSTGVSVALQHPAITSAIKRFDTVAEVRLNSLDTTYISSVGVSISGGANAITAGNFQCGGSGILNDTIIFREALSRDTTLTYSANTLVFGLSLSVGAGFSVEVGSIDLRCVSVRGETT